MREAIRADEGGHQSSTCHDMRFVTAPHVSCLAEFHRGADARISASSRRISFRISASSRRISLSSLSGQEATPPTHLMREAIRADEGRHQS
jgi:hypothetical protein